MPEHGGEGSDHWVLSSEPSDDGYRLTCACGWVSDGVAEPLRLFDRWADHVLATDVG